MHHYLRLSFILLSILGVLTGCATTSLVSSDNKIDGLLAGSEKAEDADAATGLLSSAYDLAEQLEGSRKETKSCLRVLAVGFPLRKDRRICIRSNDVRESWST